MCGITGIFKINKQPVSQQEVKSLTNALAHRGPDGEGIYVDDNLGLGHRRLSILDLSAKGSQPMTSRNNDWVIVFNGCIYNYLFLLLIQK
jgi:asparagine synthase (glutamine-hydrolysing)